MSTPTALELPAGVRRTCVRTARGEFAALEALPASGVCEREAALLVPGYTGSKEDFIAILDLLADGSRQVVAIDMRGQFETAAAGEPGEYAAAALGADVLAVMRETGARHLVGHSYGGLIGREAVLADAGASPAAGGGDLAAGGADLGAGGAGPAAGGAGLASSGAGLASGGAGLASGDADLAAGGDGSASGGVGLASFTLMSSGPAALTGPRAHELRAMLAALGLADEPDAGRPGNSGRPDAVSLPAAADLRAGIADIWRVHLEPQAVAAAVPAPIVAFLGQRMLANDPAGLVLMARHMLAAQDRTAELARLDLPMLVIYGEDDNAWSPAAQERMAQRLGARRLCIPAAMHSPAVEAPATTASALTQFWDAAEAPPARHPAAVTQTA